MKRVILVVVAAGALVLSVVVAARSPTASTPSVVLYKQMVIRHVTAEGTVEAEQATPITAPMEGHQPMKIGWVAEDQTFVHKDDVVIRFDPTDFETSLLRGTIAQEKASNKATRNEVDRTAKSLLH